MTAVSDMQLAPWPHYDADEIAAATAVLESGRVNYWTGEEGRAFETEYAAHCGVAYGLAVANGTVALELALAGLGLGAGDEVVVPARTFVATASAVVRAGATPVVADVDPVSQNLSAETLRAVITDRTRAVIPVHLAGWPADMTAIMEIASANSLYVIEDCAQAHGARLDNKPVGGIGHVGCFSFCQDKIISTGGEGGMVVTDDEAVYQRMWAYRDHGKDYRRSTEPAAAPGFRYLVDGFGTNWRLTEMQSAIGRLQLIKLSEWVDRRRALAAQFDATISGLNAVQDVTVPDSVFHSYYKYYILVNPNGLASGWDRDRIAADLEGRGIPARVGACPDIAREKAFENTGLDTSNPRPNAAALAGRTLMLPVHPTLTDGNAAFMAESLCKVLKQASR